jgi:hypothetical protein
MPELDEANGALFGVARLAVHAAQEERQPQHQAVRRVVPNPGS